MPNSYVCGLTEIISAKCLVQGLTNSKSEITIRCYYYWYNYPKSQSGKLAFMTASMRQVPGEGLSMHYPT